MGNRYRHWGSTLTCLMIALSAAQSTGCKRQGPEAAQALLNAFGGSCSSAGAWTQQAITHNQAIITVIQSIQNNDPCKPFNATLAQISSASQQVQGLLTDPSYSAYRADEENVQQLTLALQSAPNGSALQTALGQQLVTSQVSLITDRSTFNTASDLANRNRFAQATQQFSSYTQSMLQNVSGLQQCLKEYPEASIELGTNFLALGGSFLSPIFGATAAVIGQMVNLAVESARNAKHLDAIWKTFQAEVPTALGCALESTTELYCSANDSFNLLELQANSYPVPGSTPAAIWKGLDLEERRLPALTSWLLTLRNGTEPQSPNEAQNQNDAWARLQALDVYSLRVKGQINGDFKIYNGATDATVRTNILINTVMAIDGILGSYATSGNSANTNPFAGLNMQIDDFSCALVLGYPLKSCPPTEPLSGIIGAKYLAQKLLPINPTLSYANLAANFNSIYTPVQQQVSLQFSQSITQDPTPILASAFEPTTNNISPRAVLELTLDFLQESLNGNHEHGRPAIQPIIDDTTATLTMIQDGLKVIDDSFLPLSDSTPDRPHFVPKDPKEKIRTLFDIFKLQNGVQILGNRIGQFVQWDLQGRLDHGEIPTDVAGLLRVAGGDIRTRLIESGVTSLDSVSADLNHSRQISANNISVIRNYFEPLFKESVQALSEQARYSGEPEHGPDRPFGQTLGHLCTLLLATGRDWPRSVSWDICSRASIDSIYPDPDGILSVHVAQLKKDLENKSDQVRFCAYHRFLRAGRLAAVLRNRPATVGGGPWSNLMLGTVFTKDWAP